MTFNNKAYWQNKMDRKFTSFVENQLKPWYQEIKNSAKHIGVDTRPFDQDFQVIANAFASLAVNIKRGRTKEQVDKILEERAKADKVKGNDSSVSGGDKKESEKPDQG